jgi:hypothetical protein
MNKLTGNIGEVALIALGVVLGLSAESWLSTLGDRQREAEYLRDLRAEVTANRAAFDQVMLDAGRRKAVGRAVLQSSAAGLGFPDTLSHQDFRFLFELNGFRPQTATAQQLVSSGEISVIRSSQVRTALAAWLRDAEFPDLLFSFQRAHWTEVTQPMFSELGEFAAYYSTYWDGTTPGLELTPDDVVNKKQFRDALAVRLIDTEDVTYIAENVMYPSLDALDSALAGIGYD